MNKEIDLYLYLLKNHKGRARAVHSKKLEKHFKLCPRTVRKYINHLRKSGKPICSDASGYWIGNDLIEIYMNTNFSRNCKCAVDFENRIMIHSTGCGRSLIQHIGDYLLYLRLL